MLRISCGDPSTRFDREGVGIRAIFLHGTRNFLFLPRWRAEAELASDETAVPVVSSLSAPKSAEGTSRVVYGRSTLLHRSFLESVQMSVEAVGRY